MKNLRKISVLSMSVIMLAMASCSKDDANDVTLKSEDENFEVAGIYTGTLKTQGTETVTNAIFEVSRVDTQTVEIHCYGDDMDTTFMMNMYENGDSMMLCYTDSMFMSEYGHGMMGGDDDGDMGDGDGDGGMGDGDNGGMGGMGGGSGSGDGGMMGGNGDSGDGGMMGGSGNGGMMSDSTAMNCDGMMDWESHLATNHDNDDMHYGGFNLINHSVDYTIKIDNGSTVSYKRFQGYKQP